MRFMAFGPGFIGLSLPAVALGAVSPTPFSAEPGRWLFLACLVLILLLGILGLILLLAHRRRSDKQPYQPLWADLGWGLVPLVLLWALLIPAAVQVVAQP